jgi:photosystem II stability/assembly factor-like uncharacterized protein
MKKFVIVILFFFSISFQINAQWFIQNSLNVELKDISFADSNNGLAVGFSNILKTTNGGKNWFPQAIGIEDHELCTVSFVDSTNAWIATNTGAYDHKSFILHSTNEGVEWNPQLICTYEWFNSVYFLDKNHGWAVGGGIDTNAFLDKGIIYATTNGGMNWKVQDSGTRSTLFDVYFVDENHGWAVGNGKEYSIIKTTNGGANWQPVDSSYNYSGCCFIGQTGWFIGYPNSITKTTDGGATFTQQNQYNSIASNLNCIFFTDSSNGTIVGQNGLLLVTNNGGEIWYPQTIEKLYGYLYENLVSIDFSDKHNGWIAGINGTILHTTNGIINDIESKKSISQPDNFLLMQNYPNPFNPSTTIEYEIPKQSHVTIKIFDLLGREVATLVNDRESAGKYKIKFDGSGLSTGIYLYRMEAGNFSQTRKLILIK